MKRQHYFPRLVSQRQEWFNQFATELTPANVTLQLPAADVMTPSSLFTP